MIFAFITVLLHQAFSKQTVYFIKFGIIIYFCIDRLLALNPRADKVSIVLLAVSMILGNLLNNTLIAHGERIEAENNSNQRQSLLNEDYRGNTESNSNIPESYNSDNSLSCARTPTCKQINSCREARFYYSECNLYRLDGDSDGIPCENLCGN